jgi:hypothetical protein
LSTDNGKTWSYPPAVTQGNTIMPAFVNDGYFYGAGSGSASSMHRPVHKTKMFRRLPPEMIKPKLK